LERSEVIPPFEDLKQLSLDQWEVNPQFMRHRQLVGVEEPTLTQKVSLAHRHEELLRYPINDAH
jgi:hypothetical protein